MQEGAKPLQFHGSAGGYFINVIIVAILSIIPLIGSAMGVHILAKWWVENSSVDGKKLTYNASFGETTMYAFIRILLVLITLGIYIFWAAPQIVKFVYQHSSVASAAPAAAAPTPTPEAVAPAVAAPEMSSTATTAPEVSAAPSESSSEVVSAPSETSDSTSSSSSEPVVQAPSSESSEDNTPTPPPSAAV